MRCEHCGEEHEPGEILIDLTMQVPLSVRDLAALPAEQLEADVAHRLRGALEAMIADKAVLRALEATQARLCPWPASGQDGGR